MLWLLFYSYSLCLVFISYGGVFIIMYSTKLKMRVFGFGLILAFISLWLILVVVTILLSLCCSACSRNSAGCTKFIGSTTTGAF